MKLSEADKQAVIMNRLIQSGVTQPDLVGKLLRDLEAVGLTVKLASVPRETEAK